jgi:hypothetical protein
MDYQYISDLYTARDYEPEWEMKVFLAIEETNLLP